VTATFGTPIGPTPVRAWWTGVAEGDQRGLARGAPPPAPLGADMALFAPRQVHGADILVVDADALGAEGPDGSPIASAGAVGPFVRDGAGAPPAGDAVVAVAGGACLAVVAADCGAVALATPQGVRAAVHVGWRGLVAGVVERAVAVVRALGGDPVYGGVGPSIRACCYHFSPADVARVSSRYGAGVEGRTTEGAPALDLPAGLDAALGGAGVEVVVRSERCTGCSPGFYSHRRRGDVGRQAVFVWAEP
jgi:copper oxidase (laccase) domain-containing protein